MARKTDEEVDDTTPAAPDPWAVLEKLGTALAAINEKLSAQPVAPNADHMLEIQRTLATALERVADATKQGAEATRVGAELQASETRRAHRPSNEVVPQISVFNRRGANPIGEGPVKPPLKCLMLLPWIAEWESLTREEVQLLNLLESGEYTLKRIDNSKVRLTVLVELKVDGRTPSRLLMTHDTAFNNDNFRLTPPLPDMLRQLLRQHGGDIPARASLVMTDEEEEALIEAGELSVTA